MKYWVHPTRGLFHKGAVWYNPGMPYPLPDDATPMAGSIETDEFGTPVKPPAGETAPTKAKAEADAKAKAEKEKAEADAKAKAEKEKAEADAKAKADKDKADAAAHAAHGKK